MKKYLSLLRMRFIAGLQYRAAALAGIATQFAWGFMLILMFSAFYRSDASAFPMSLAQTASYIWLQQAFLALLMVWFLDSEIISSITNGNVAYELCRPIDLYAMWFFKNVAWPKLSFAACPFWSSPCFSPLRIRCSFRALGACSSSCYRSCLAWLSRWHSAC